MWRPVPQHPAIIGLQLDVTKPDQVQAVADQIDAENPSGLYGLVNNAGGGGRERGQSTVRGGMGSIESL